MKRMLAVLLTLILALGACVGALAEGETTPTLTDHETVTIHKVYKLVGAGTSPAETFTLRQVGDGRVTDGEAKEAPVLGTITGAAFTEGAATVDGTTGDITIALPSYERVGVYEYTLQEVAGETAGVTYYGDTIRLVVTVVNDNNGKLRIAAVHTKSEGKEKKNDNFPNTYSAGKLEVSKTVEGNMGDSGKYFEFKVTLMGETGKTYGETYAVSGGSNASNPNNIKIGEETTFLLKHGDTLSIANLPYGVTYTVTEPPVENYTTTKTGDTGEINAAAQTAAFVNTRTAEIDMGVTTVYLTYAMLLGFVTLLGAAMLLKRHALNG